MVISFVALMVVVEVSTGFFRWIGGVFSKVGARESNDEEEITAH